eukprot:6092827-Pleurochrysis_carterae.AAC.5
MAERDPLPAMLSSSANSESSVRAKGAICKLASPETWARTCSHSLAHTDLAAAQHRQRRRAKPARRERESTKQRQQCTHANRFTRMCKL